MARLAAALVLLLSVACGEPPIDVELPEREAGAHVADLAGVVDAAALQERLAAIAADGRDIVALTYETEQAGCGEASRAAARFVAEWDADVALVAVAQPGDFTSTDDARERCIGVQPREERGLPADLRERIAEELVPPLARENDWTGAFEVAIDAVAAQ